MARSLWLEGSLAYVVCFLMTLLLQSMRLYLGAAIISPTILKREAPHLLLNVVPSFVFASEVLVVNVMAKCPEDLGLHQHLPRTFRYISGTGNVIFLATKLTESVIHSIQGYFSNHDHGHDHGHDHSLERHSSFDEVRLKTKPLLEEGVLHAVDLGFHMCCLVVFLLMLWYWAGHTESASTLPKATIKLLRVPSSAPALFNVVAGALHFLHAALLSIVALLAAVCAAHLPWFSEQMMQDLLSVPVIFFLGYVCVAMLRRSFRVFMLAAPSAGASMHMRAIISRKVCSTSDVHIFGEGDNRCQVMARVTFPSDQDVSRALNALRAAIAVEGGVATLDLDSPTVTSSPPIDHSLQGAILSRPYHTEGQI